jgi:NADPH2:quinone reductase
MRAVQITEFGGPEVLTLVDLPEPTPGDGQVLVRVDRAGVNDADTHHAENSYLARVTVPLVPGGEVVGRTPQGRRTTPRPDDTPPGRHLERARADPAGGGPGEVRRSVTGGHRERLTRMVIRFDTLQRWCSPEIS